MKKRRKEDGRKTERIEKEMHHRVIIHQRSRAAYAGARAGVHTNAVESGLAQILQGDEALWAGPEDDQAHDHRAGRHGQAEESVNQQQIAGLEPVLLSLQGLRAGEKTSIMSSIMPSSSSFPRPLNRIPGSREAERMAGLILFCAMHKR